MEHGSGLSEWDTCASSPHRTLLILLTNTLYIFCYVFYLLILILRKYRWLNEPSFSQPESWVMTSVSSLSNTKVALCAVTIGLLLVARQRCCPAHLVAGACTSSTELWEILSWLRFNCERA